MELVLTGLRVENFRSLRDVSIDFSPVKPHLCLFIGKNDAGKSNILRAIKLVLSEDRPEPEDFQVKEQPIEIDATFINPENPDGTKFICHYSYSLSSGRRGPSLSWEPSPPGVQFEPVYIPSLRDIVDEFKYTERSKNVFSSLISPLLNNKDIEQAKETLQKKVNEAVRDLSRNISNKVRDLLGRTDILLKLSPEVKTSYDFSNIQTGYGHLSCHGHGTQSCVVMAIFDVYAELAKNKDRKVKNLYFLIEEPENHLHPELQRAMAYRLRQLAEEYQVFVSTHSPFILDRSLDTKCYMVSFESSKGTYVKYIDINHDFYELVTEIGARPSDLLQHDAALLVEGLSDAGILREWLQLYSKSLGRNLASRVLVIPIGGSMLYSEKISDTLMGLKKNTNVWVLVDSDRDNAEQDFGPENADKKRKLKGICNNLNIPFTATYRREIENYFSMEAIKAVLEKDVDPAFENPFSDAKKLLKAIGYGETRHGPKIASLMKPEDLKNTDIWKLFDAISQELYNEKVSRPIP